MWRPGFWVSIFHKPIFFVVGYSDEVFLYVCFFVHHIDRLPLMVSCLVPMNRWPTCLSVWQLQEQIPTFGLTWCVQDQLIKTGLSKWETSEKSFFPSEDSILLCLIKRNYFKYFWSYIIINISSIFQKVLCRGASYISIAY